MMCKGHAENGTQIHSQNRLAHTQTEISVHVRILKYITNEFRYINADWYSRRLIKNAICQV